MKRINEFLIDANTKNNITKTVYSVLANKLDASGNPDGYSEIICFDNKLDAQEFKKQFEKTWEENTKNHISKDPCWMGYEKKIQIKEKVIYTDYKDFLINKVV